MIGLSFVTLTVVSIGLAQWLFGVVGGRRQSQRLAAEEALRASESNPAGEASGLELMFLIPCLDEERVIGATVDALLAAAPHAHIVVIDDASSDRTAEIAEARPGVEVVRRELPAARAGKGAALNAGLVAVRRRCAARGLDAGRVIVGVMDADGRLSPGAVPIVLGHFEDPEVGGLQLPVRIRNTERLITRYQDFEFWGVAAGAQVARAGCGSTSLGGNGQFSRLSALEELGPRPWSRALTEDLDLAVSLLVRGWRLTSSPSAHVTQQGVDDVRRLLTQRTRWMQGHMATGRRLPELWQSPRVGTAALIECAGYLAVPWILVLPWSVLFHLSVLAQVQFLTGPMPATILGSQASARVAWFVAWYFASFGPALSAARSYSRRSDMGRFRALLLAHLFLAFNYVSFIAAWRALARMALGRGGWAKTGRSEEVIDLRSPAADRLPAPRLLETA